MTDAIIIQGEYSTIRHVPSRKVAQVIVEIPQERMAEWMELFGSPGAGTQVAIARLADPKASVNASPKADKGRKNWAQLPAAQQAGIRCNEPEFWRFADVQNADEAAAWVREQCQIASRSELKPGSKAAYRWEQIDMDFMQFERTRPAA